MNRVLAFCCLLLIATAASAQDCKKPPIENCPATFVDRCKADRAFLTVNSAQCLKLASSPQTNPESCQLPETCKPACLSATSIEYEIEEFLASCGFPKCPSSVKQIKSELVKVTNSLSNELHKYGAILNLDPFNINDTSELCKYKPEEITNYGKLAQADPATLTKATDDVQFLRGCGDYVMHFIAKAARKGWSAPLRDKLVRAATADSEEARAESSRAETAIAKLREAPKRIKELSEIHKIGC